MRLALVRCLLLNLIVIAVSAALLTWYPAQLGFTVTSSRTTHYLSGNIFLSGVLLCLLDTAIGLYMAWSLFHPR